MDNRQNVNLHELFSRGSTPPIQSSQPQQYPAPIPHIPHNVSPPNQIDALFQQLSSSSPSDHQHTTQSNDEYSNSMPNTPVMSISDEPSSISATSSAADRQSALLSLLGGASASTVASTGAGPQVPQQQIPTPPGSSQRSGTSPTHSETQGKILLEQLMAGQPSRSNYSDTQRNPGSDRSSTPPYVSNQHESEYRPYGQHDPAIELARGPQVPQPSMQQQSYQQPLLSSTSQQQQNQPPSPRKSMFDFVSPFDALSSSGPGKKKQVPAQPSSVSSGNEDSGWTSVPAPDPKRQSVDNLLETLARAQIIQPPPASQAPASYDPYGEYTSSEQVQSRVPPPPLPPKPAGIPNRTASPRASPPKPQAQRARVIEPPTTQQASSGNNNNHNRRDKESSPGPNARGSLRGKGKFNKNVNSPSPQAQNIVFDVSQSLEEIQAPHDSVKSTAIALVRQDSVFLPGTTIGATHWVAYAMTRGRIRVISRSSGDRTLLQLPSVFPPGASVTDMAVYGNRLAGVTSDGGFVVWELPEVITDDVPGQLLLCIAPANNQEALQSVKWHPKEPDTLAVASETQIYLIDLANAPALRGQILPQSDLVHIGQVFPVASTLVAFDFDILHYALATISTDSTLTIWNIQDQLPYSTHKVRGEDAPSSLTFVDGGIVVGRKNGTIFQLLSMTTKAVLSTVKFVNGSQEDPDMFGHVSYDSRIQTLWVANCRRESMIALRINLETTVNANGEEAIRGYFEQVIEFAGPKSTIHFVILTADADPNGDEAYAACVAAKVPPGELALVAFSVHSSGVDQILIRKEWFDAAVSSTQAKYPPHALPQNQMSQHQPQSSQPASEPTRGQRPSHQSNSGSSQAQHQAPARLRTPPSEEIEADIARDEGRQETKGKGKGKNVNFEKNAKSADSAIISESALGQALSKEIRKSEENLHTRIGRLLGKEMDKQHQRLEEARAHEQAEDFARQEKILKLISTELTRNTTRVVEAAVKSEVQNSVLPSLESITKNEVKAALNDQVGRGLVDFISQSLPVELEKLLLRSDISGHFSHILSTNLSPLIDRHVKEAVNKTLIPVYSQQSSAMHQELLRELRNEIITFKSELTGWQSDALRTQENSIRELERTVRTLSDQVKYLSVNQTGSTIHHIQQSSHNSSPGSNMPQNSMNQPHLRQPNISTNLPSSSSSQLSSQLSPPNYLSNQSHFAPPQTLQQHWFGPTIAAPQASHPVLPPPAAHPQPERSPSIPPEQWDETYLGVLHTQDTVKLRELLSRTNPELIMPLNGKALVSQAVILTLVHRLSAIIGELSPTDESFKTSLWWLQRSVAILHPEDKLITDFIPRVIPNVQVSLNTTKQRLAIPVPGGPPTLDIARTISDIQESLRRKVAPLSA